METEELKEITFIDVAFIEKKPYKAIVLICKSEDAADRFYSFLRTSAFILKHRIENSGYYTVAIESSANPTTELMFTLRKTKKQYPPLGWLDNHTVTHAVTAYVRDGTLQIIEPPLPIEPPFRNN